MAAVKTKKRVARDVYAELQAKHAKTLVARIEEILCSPLAEGEETFHHITPSGMEWTLRLPNMSLFVKAGLLPTALAMKMALLTNEGKGNEIFRHISSRELAQTIEFNSSVICYIAVEPRIVATPVKDNEIAFDAVARTPDYDDLLAWASKRGEEAGRLGNFPK